jgi:hypothetical protein
LIRRGTTRIRRSDGGSGAGRPGAHCSMRIVAGNALLARGALDDHALAARARN